MYNPTVNQFERLLELGEGGKPAKLKFSISKVDMTQVVDNMEEVPLITEGETNSVFFSTFLREINFFLSPVHQDPHWTIDEEREQRSPTGPNALLTKSLPCFLQKLDISPIFTIAGDFRHFRRDQGDRVRQRAPAALAEQGVRIYRVQDTHRRTQRNEAHGRWTD